MNVRFKSVHASDDRLWVWLKDGREISAPLAWYPCLHQASSEQRAVWQVCADGCGIYWPLIDEHLSTEGLLKGWPSPEFLRIKKARRSAAAKTSA